MADESAPARDELRTGREQLGLDLRADCAKCVGLCCVALSLVASADFAIDKPAGQPCPNLSEDFRCEIHSRLRAFGFKGCTAYDCFGAGQRVSQTTFAGRNWRTSAEMASSMFAVFHVMRQLHESLWYLREALGLIATGSLHDELRGALDETERLCVATADALLHIDAAAHRDRVSALLARTSEFVRAASGRPVTAPALPRRRFGPGADLIGAKLKGADLRGADLKGAYLIAADLRDADLTIADLLGADLRDADLAGADLSRSLFVTQAQINAAIGDSITELPPALRRPSHWMSCA